MSNLKSFRCFSEENNKNIVVIFGRFNPPTLGHEKLLNHGKRIAGSSTYRIYASQSVDPKKNPLSYDEKIAYMRKAFPSYGRNIIFDKSIKNVLQLASKTYDEGFTTFTLVAGSDRVKEFKDLLQRYNGIKSSHGYYNFDSINIASAGERDPDADDVSGMSASKMRAAAAADDYTAFSRGVPSSYKKPKELYNALRRGMGLAEASYVHSFGAAVKNELREAYIAGEIYNVGDVVRSVKDDAHLKILERHTNYVLAENQNSGESKKYFIADLIRI